jgi:hypothetical protein
VLSFTKYINELTITINGETIFQVKKSQKVKPSSQTTLTCKESNLTNPNSTQMLLCNSIVHAEQRYKIAHGPSITLDYLDVVMTVNIDKEFHDKIRDVIRKRLPSTIHIKLLFPSKHVSTSSRKCQIYQFLSFRFFKIYNLLNPKTIHFINRFLIH